MKRSGRPVQPTPPAHPRATAHRHLGSLLRSRVVTKELADSYKWIEKRFNSLPSHKPLVDAFIQLKYKKVDDRLSECAATLQSCKAEHQALSSLFQNQVTAVVSQITNRVLQAEKTTQIFISELKSLSKSMQKNSDSMIVHNTIRVSKANVTTQECLAEWEAISFSILKRIATVVSQNKNRVLQAEKITQNYIAEVTQLSSSIIGLERIQAVISKAKKEIERIDHEFCATVFTQTPKWTQKLKRLDKTIWLWQRDLRVSENTLLEPRVNISDLSIRQLKDTLDNEFLRPQEAARRRIDKIIASLKTMNIIYAELQRKSSAVRDNYDVKSLCYELGHNEKLSSEQRLTFCKFSEIIHRDSREFGRVAHTWRSRWRERWKADNILRESEDYALRESEFWSMRDLAHLAKDTSSEYSDDDILTNFALGSFDSKIPRIVDVKALRVSSELQKKYNSLWKPTTARNPELHIYWRQLDVLGPIQLVDVLTWRLANDVWYLYDSLKGEIGTLWDWMPQIKVARIAQLIGLWSNQFQAHRSDFRANYTEFVYLNWVRLQSETKLHSMKEPAHLAGRFEVINPLSQDLSRFTQWTDRMAQFSQDAYIYSLARRFQPAFWEKLHGTLESIGGNQSLARELMKPKPKPKRIKTRDASVQGSLRSYDRHIKWRPPPPRQVQQYTEPPDLFLEKIRNFWIENKLKLSSVDSTSKQGGRKDAQTVQKISPIPKQFRPAWFRFRDRASRAWCMWANQNERELRTDPSLQHPQSQFKEEWLKQILDSPSRRHNPPSADMLKQAELALDLWADPGKRRDLEIEHGPRPILEDWRWSLGLESLRRYTSSSWASDELDTRNLPVLTEDLYNDWLDFQHFTSILWCKQGSQESIILTKRQWMNIQRKHFMRAWASRQQQLYQANSGANQGPQRDYQTSLTSSSEPSTSNVMGMLGSKQRPVDPAINQGNQKNSQAIHEPSPSPFNETTERHIAESKFMKPHAGGFNSTTQRTKLMPHEMAQRVQSILITDSDDKSADILPTTTVDLSNVDTCSNAARDKPLTSDRAFNYLFSIPKGRVPAGRRRRRRGEEPASLVFRHKPQYKNERGYSTDASPYRVNCQQTGGDVSHESLPEQSLVDETSPPVTSTETRRLGESVSANESVPYLEADSTTPLFWSHTSQQSPDGQKLIVHYCRTLRSTEETVQHFLGSKIIGFDMEWKPSASSWDNIQNNVSLIQIANEERIAIFQIALFKPARTLNDLVSPSLKRLIESPDVTKVGVSIKADCTRLRKYLGIDAKATFELSHLFKLVKHGKDNPNLVNKRGVNLSDQMEEHFGLPLDKSEDVRCGDWTRALTYRQVQCE